MPIKRPALVTNEVYHVITRGAGDSVVFKNRNDYFRGIFSLYEFNTAQGIVMRERRKLRSKFARERFSGELMLVEKRRSHNRLVEILAFCFMPNHVHLLLKQKKKKGISDFMRKFGAGYVGYFNRRHGRKGPLFARFRAVHIETDDQLKIVMTYIHTNPVALLEPGWKENGIKSRNLTKVNNFLSEYKWSSYLDYIGKKNFPSVIERAALLDLWGGKKGCEEFVQDWLLHKEIS